VEHAPDPLKTGSIALLEVLEGLPDATVGATRDGRIVFVNGLAEEQFGYQRDELLGQPIETLWPERVRGATAATSTSTSSSSTRCASPSAPTGGARTARSSSAR
jgi:PAS domain-containing protein